MINLNFKRLIKYLLAIASFGTDSENTKTTSYESICDVNRFNNRKLCSKETEIVTLSLTSE